MTQKVTVIVPCFNEEEDIRECLESVKWADDIFVVDSYSTDRTLEIAREYTSHIVQHEYVNSATQKNWAIPQVKTEWAMVLDADERVTPDLQARIKKILQEGTDRDGFYVKRMTVFFGKLIKHCGWHREYLVRFWRADKGLYADRSVHSDVVLKGKAGRINEHIIHDTYKSFADYMEKFDRYTTWAANDLNKKGVKPTLWHLWCKPLLRFIKMYFFNHGFLDGKHGFILCKLAAYSVFMKYAKVWEMRRGNGE